MRWWRVAGFAWLAFLSAAYFWPSDSLYTLTIWPPFVWTCLAIALSLFGIRKKRDRLQLVLLGAWIAFWFAFGEEKHWIGDRHDGLEKPDLTIVTLNCAGGSPEAAEEAFAKHPDIILFQESPSATDLHRLAKKYFGAGYGLASGVDASIVSRNGLQVVRSTISTTEARIHTSVGHLRVVSLRLSPPTFRLDYWNPECWRAYAENRQLHREELAESVKQNLSFAHRPKTILGGDFNWTPDREMSSILMLLYPVSQGSGYTAVNEFPLARIDQVWVSREFRGISEAVTTKNSDHRMVVVKLRKIR